MKRKRTPQELFNFSFVDIMATTIGVIIFIMVLVVLNSVNRISGEGIKQKKMKLENKKVELVNELDDLKERVSSETKRKELLENAVNKGMGVFHLIDKKCQEQEQQKLQKKNTKFSAYSKRIENDIKQLKEQCQDFSKEDEEMLEQVNKKRSPVLFRVPKERKTSKLPIMLECDDNKLYVMAYKQKLDKRNYNMKNCLNFYLISRKPNAIGETLETLKKSDSIFQKALKQSGNKKFYAIFVVRDDSFAFFRKVRKIMWDLGWDLTWEPFRKRKALIIPASGKGQGTIM